MPEIYGYGFGRVTVDVEIHRTAEAVWRYAQLDPRKTAAALHPTC